MIIQRRNSWCRSSICKGTSPTVKSLKETLCNVKRALKLHWQLRGRKQPLTCTPGNTNLVLSASLSGALHYHLLVQGTHDNWNNRTSIFLSAPILRLGQQKKIFCPSQATQHGGKTENRK